jgi:hypothetical protein
MTRVQTQTHHDHIHQGQDKSENGPQLALKSVSRGVWHCVVQHFQNVVQRSAKLPGIPILMPVGMLFPSSIGRLACYGVALQWRLAQWSLACYGVVCYSGVSCYGIFDARSIDCGLCSHFGSNATGDSILRNGQLQSPSRTAVGRRSCCADIRGVVGRADTWSIEVCQGEASLAKVDLQAAVADTDQEAMGPPGEPPEGVQGFEV